MTVLGIGGIFMRAKDPDALADWYRTYLNVGPGCRAPGAGDADDMSWMVEGGPVVFAPFPSDSEYFPTDKAFMLNLRVQGLAGMIDRLRSDGVTVETREEWNHPDIGQFARIQDLEGNPVELWEPPV